jgi:ferredoxin|tara:strand:- start:252 stop:539 length:288 start_codon:yes stop_codon:yes gene_type:complete
MAIARFFRGGLLLGSIEVEDGEFLVDLADSLGIDIPRNCTSGNCGTCLVRLISGKVPYPDPLPPGLDEFLIEDGGILACCMTPEGSCDIDTIPPL